MLVVKCGVSSGDGRPTALKVGVGLRVFGGGQWCQPPVAVGVDLPRAGDEHPLTPLDVSFAVQCLVHLFLLCLVDTYNIPDVTSCVKSACRENGSQYQHPVNGLTYLIHVIG
nr:MAG TPA: hypothetical protein [Caudoviricetes sp.]